jgi:MraZ protein
LASFRGSFRHTLDGKGRLALSTSVRRVTGVREKDGPQPFLILTKGLNGCVWAYTEDEWARLEGKLRQKQFDDDASRDFALEMMASVQDVPIDAAGRILLPQTYLDLAGLSRGGDVMVIGMMDHLELWDPERFEKHIGTARKRGSYEESSRELLKS